MSPGRRFFTGSCVLCGRIWVCQYMKGFVLYVHIPTYFLYQETCRGDQQIGCFNGLLFHFARPEIRKTIGWDTVIFQVDKGRGMKRDHDGYFFQEWISEMFLLGQVISNAQIVLGLDEIRCSFPLNEKPHNVCKTVAKAGSISQRPMQLIPVAIETQQSYPFSFSGQRVVRDIIVLYKYGHAIRRRCQHPCGEIAIGANTSTMKRRIFCSK